MPRQSRTVPTREDLASVIGLTEREVFFAALNDVEDLVDYIAELGDPAAKALYGIVAENRAWLRANNLLQEFEAYKEQDE